MRVHGSRDLPNFLSKRACQLFVGAQIGSGELDINGSGQAKIQDLRDDVRGLKEKFHAGELLRQGVPEIRDQFGRGPVPFFQGHQ